MSGRMPITHWLTTAPNPRTPATGVNAGQRGWRQHAVTTGWDNFKQIRFVAAECGMTPSHGWGLDGFIEDKCERCLRALSRRE